MSEQLKNQLVDRFGRSISYLRLSVTDRCDFRCIYCMDEEMTFVPRSEVLSFEEMQCVAKAFVGLGVKKIRLTGGEPLVRANVVALSRTIANLEGLDELVMTTNGSQLPKLAVDLRNAGVKRLNISLDTLRAGRFKALTRTGSLVRVLAGINAACEQGFEAIKLNCVILKGRNDDEILDLVEFALGKQIDISFIEEMPLGQVSSHNRREAFMASADIRDVISKRYFLTRLRKDSFIEGPSKYFSINGFKSRIGFISPHSENFCADCNRVRVTAEGRLLLCLGNEDALDLKTILRSTNNSNEALQTAIIKAMNLKPERHYFDDASAPQIVRFMNATGG